jgi:hypothetical protein
VCRQDVISVCRLGAAIGFLLLGAKSAQAMSLSTYRIYLDSDNSTASFLMFNKAALPQTCALNLVHKNYDELGTPTIVDANIIPEHSAGSWIRYSPKNFTAAPRSPQTVRFTLRRQPNALASEYRSYLEVFCDTTELQPEMSESTSDQPVIGIKPRLVQNVPIIVRIGKLEAQVSFSNIQQDNADLIFNLQRQGNRSVYGSLQLVDKKTDEIISYVNNISVYTETKQRAFKLNLHNKPVSELALKFVEDEKYGGSITYQQDVVLN